MQYQSSQLGVDRGSIAWRRKRTTEYVYRLASDSFLVDAVVVVEFSAPSAKLNLLFWPNTECGAHFSFRNTLRVRFEKGEYALVDLAE